MTLTNFKAVLAAHPHKTVRFVLPKGDCIPPSYHITEVGRVQKDFIDCGGTVRSSASCVLQAWVAANDEDHRLKAGKLSIILQMADKLLTDSGLLVEVEYEAPIISQFAVSGSEVDSHRIVFHLENKRTDCLAKESCGLEASSCCSGEEASCGA